MRSAAEALAALGFRVLPIRPGQKHPPMAAWQQAATVSEATIGNWWTGLYQGFGVGIATGHLADGGTFFVLDIDERDAYSGRDTLAELESVHGPLPPTITSITGTNSEHRFLRPPAGWPVPRNDQSGKIGAGLDIRGEGGQVVVAPTIHPNGNAYAWMIDHGPGEIDMAEAPEWLMQLLAPVERPAATPAAPNVQRDVFTLATSPADRYNGRTTWTELLTRDGWTLHHTDSDGEQHWTRPGKDAREGASATVGWRGLDILKVFTSAVPGLDADRSYSRFGYTAAMHHGGDERAMARQILADEASRVLAVPGPVEVAPEVASDYDAALRAMLLDWPTFWAKDTSDAEWLVEPVLAAGRSTAIFAPGGTGKSLFTLWLVASLACGRVGLDGWSAMAPATVLYLDYEMTADDLAERLTAMGFGPGDDLGRLHYALLPSLPPADAPEGGKAIARLAELVDADLVVIDTFGRAVAGDENEADTVRSFYRWTGLHLKAAGRAFVRIDHAGKDIDKGQRGTSAKNDDVDVVWKLTRSEGGAVLTATKRRMGWVPERVMLVQHDEPELRYRLADEVVPAGTARVVDDLDDLDVPVDASARSAARALRDGGRRATNEVVRAAQKVRRMRLLDPVDNPAKARRDDRRRALDEPETARSDGALHADQETPGSEARRAPRRASARPSDHIPGAPPLSQSGAPGGAPSPDPNMMIF